MADADKLYNRTGTWGDSTLGDGDPVTPAYLGGVDTNALLLGRNRYTGGADVLAQPDCEIGATWAGPDGTLWFYRLDGTATSDDETRAGLASPLRAIWHYDDRDGEPETDGRSINGDLIIWDDGTNDRFLGVCTGSGVYGLGVRADYRTAATSGAGAKQHSDRVTWRASSWNGSAAKYREWRARAYVVTDASGADAWDWRLSRFAESGTERDVLQLSRNGELRLQGNADAAGIVLSSSLDGTGTVTGQFGYLTSTSTDPDQAACVFVHGQATRRAIWRFKNPTSGYTGFNAETIALRPYEEASVGTQLVNSPAITLRGNYWNGASFTESGFYQQVVMTATTPTGYLEFGPNFGSGVYQFHHDGLLGIAGSSTGGVLLSRYTTASGGDTTVDSSRATWRGSYHDGSAHDADFYAQHILDTTDPTGRLRIGSDYGVGLWDFADDGSLILQSSTPANDDVSNPQKIIDSTDLVLRGHSWDGAASVDRDMRIRCFVASSADEGDVWAMLYDNGTTDAGGVLMDGTRMVGDAAANVLSFTLDAGTHPAVQSGTTKTTPGGVDAWLALDVNGTTYYVPAYTSKTA